MSTIYGTPLHRALRVAIAHFGNSRSANAERVLNDIPAGTTLEGICGALGECALVTSEIDSASLERALGPESSLLGIGRDRYIVVTHSGGRRVDEVIISTADGLETHHRPKRRDIERRHLGETLRWLVIFCEEDLSSMARPGGSMEPWARLRELLRIESRDLKVVLLYAATLGTLTLLTPVATQALVNTIAFGAIMQPLLVLTAALFIGLALAGALAALQAYVVEVLQRRILVRVAEDFAGRLPRVSAHARDRKNLVELSNRFFDVITVQKSAAELLLSGLGLVLQTVVGMILLGFYHPILLGFDIVLIALLLAVVWMGRGGSATAIAESKEKFALAAWLDELARVPQLFVGGQGRLLAREELSKRSMNYVRARRAHYRHVFSVLAGGIALQVLAIVGMLGVGGWLVIKRQLTLGQLVAAEIVVSIIAVGIAKFGRLADKTFDLVAATDKLGKVLDLPLRRGGRDPLPADERGLELRALGLCSGYAEKPAHSPIDFQVLPGAKVLLEGARGSGRSALLETLAAVRNPVQGSLSWNGRSRPKISDAKERIVLVRPEIIAGTVFTNLRIGNAALSTSRAWQALEAVGLAPVVNSMPNGLDCELVPSGAPFSPGQTCRLALARALVATPSLVLIDETLDFLCEEDSAQAQLVELFAASDAPWTAVIASRDPRVITQLREVVSIGKRSP